jgi:hypothetical protein
MKRIVAIFILLLGSFAQARAEQLPIRTYTTADGLARDRVYKIVPDPRATSKTSCKCTRSRSKRIS